MPASLLPAWQQAKAEGRRQFVVLVDPDKVRASEVPELARRIREAGVDMVFVGGSLMVEDRMKPVVVGLKRDLDIPIVLFPGSPLQLCHEADALLYLSLISGRNADLLIGRHVESVPFLWQSPLEVIPTGYMLIDGGAPTTASYMSGTPPIPADKADVALCTAMAGQMLGLQVMYLDAGSGARNPVSLKMLRKISHTISCPIIVGGGIRTPQRAGEAAAAGADIVVVGNILEKDPELMRDFAAAVHGVTVEG